MRASIKNYTDALKQQRIERGEDGGFSLIELIIVVVILGILAAIAIPIFLNIQEDARENAAAAVAGNAATQAAAAMAQGTDAADVDLDNLATTDTAGDGVALTLPATGLDIDKICVTATVEGVTAYAGPGMTGGDCTP